MALVHWDEALASQHVCSATLSGSLPACCMVITYELGVEEVDGQDVNTKKKKWTQSKRLPVEAERERESKWENRAKQDNKTTGGTTNVT